MARPLYPNALRASDDSKELGNKGGISLAKFDVEVKTALAESLAARELNNCKDLLYRKPT
jgi:hypothetical protein